jgi:hypothetical protein
MAARSGIALGQSLRLARGALPQTPAFGLLTLAPDRAVDPPRSVVESSNREHVATRVTPTNSFAPLRDTKC